MLTTLRRFGVLLTVFIPISLFGQIELGEMINFSESDGTPSDEQNMAQDGENYYLVWNEWGNLVFRKSGDAGESWSERQTIFTAMDYGASYPVVAASGDNVYVFYFRNTTGNQQVFMLKSDDGGASFSDEVQVSDAENGAQIPQAYAVGEKVFLAYEGRDSNYDYQIIFQKSTNTGQTWSDATFLTDSQTGSGWCNLTYHDETLFVSYNEQTGEDYDDLDVFFTKSDDEGANWTEPVNVSQNQDYNARLSTVALDSSVYIVSSSKVDGIQSDIRMYRSFDRGDSWESPQLITDNSGDNSRPDIWVAPNAEDDHRIYIVYSDGTYTGYENTYLKYSVDNGNNWSEHHMISQEIEDGAWPQIVGQAGEQDSLFMAWNRPFEGTFIYEVWGRSAVNDYAAVATINGTVENQNSEPVSGADVFVGTYSTTTAIDGTFSLEVPAGTYGLTVEADGYNTYFEEIEVESGNTYDYEIELTPFSPVLFPPLNPEYTIEFSDLTLSWDPPASSGAEMRYDDGDNSDEVGGEVEHFEAAIRFPVDDLEPYEGRYLTEVNFYITDANCQVLARVWTGGNENFPGDLVFEQEVEDLQQGWNHAELEQPILIEGDEELWMGYRVLNPEGVYPAGTDNGPAKPYKGDMILYYSEWVSMSEYFGWDINWNIYGLAVSTETPARKASATPMVSGNGRNSRIADFDSYNVYKNGELIGSVPSSETSYVDEGLEMGTFTYEVTSAFEDQESEPSEALTVIVTSSNQTDAKEMAIRVKPNPATNLIKVDVSDNMNLRKARFFITDMQGRIVIGDERFRKQKSQAALAIPEKLHGMYLLHIITESEERVEKMIVR